MSDTLAAARRSQIVFAVLLVVCVAQVGWWMLDQWMYSAEIQRRAHASWARDIAAAEAMLSRGIPAPVVAPIFPDLTVADAGPVTVNDGARQAVGRERGSRLNRYFWEGAFFLVVLSAAIAVLWRTTNVEFRLRRRQQNFVTAVTHELKSPLAGVRLAAETMHYRDADEATRKRLINRLLRSLDRMEETVSNVLETARIDERQVSLEPTALPVAALLAEIVADLEPGAADAGVAIRCTAPAELAAWVDRRAMTTVLRNLIANAVSAAAGTEAAAIDIAAHDDGDAAIVEVRDNGHGFDPADGEKLFEKFYRPGDELRRAGRGTGLGLYIARNLVTASGGTLRAASEGRGRGASFRTSWPLAPTGASR